MSPTFSSGAVRVGALAVTFALGLAVITSPGIACADEPTDPGPSAEVQSAESTNSPESPDSTDEQTPEPGDPTGPSEPAAPPPGNNPTIIRQGESPPVVIDSSGGLVDDGEAEAPEATPISEPPPAPEVSPTVVPEPASSAPSSPPPSAPVAVVPSAPTHTTSGVYSAPRPARSAAAALPVPKSTTAPRSTGPVTAEPQPVSVQTFLQQTTLTTDTAVAEEVAVASNHPTPSLMSTSGTFIGVATSLLAAALTPFFAPGPTTPAQTPVLWAVLAWVRREFSRESYSQALQPVTPGDTQSLDTTSLIGDMVRGDPDSDGAFTGSFTVVDMAGEVDVSIRDSGRSRYGTTTFTVTPDTGTTRVVNYRYAPTDAGRLRAGASELTDRLAFTVVDGEKPAETLVVADIAVPPARLVLADWSLPVAAAVAGVAVVGDDLFVADQQNDTVAAIGIGAAAGIFAIDVGAAPTCLVAHGDRLYVANGGDDSVSVIALGKESGRHVETDRILVGASPFDMAVSAGLLYVANSLDGTVSVIDTRTSLAVDTITLDDGVWSLAAARGKVYVANGVDGTVTVIDADPARGTTANSVIGTVDLVDGVATALAATPDGSRVWATAVHEIDGEIVVIDTENDSVTGDSVPVRVAAADVVFSPDGSIAYLADTDGTIAAVDTSTFEVVATVRRVPDSDVGFLAVSADGGRIYVSSMTDDAMSAIERA